LVSQITPTTGDGPGSQRFDQPELNSEAYAKIEEEFSPNAKLSMHLGFEHLRSETTPYGIRYKFVGFLVRSCPTWHCRTDAGSALILRQITLINTCLLIVDTTHERSGLAGIQSDAVEQMIDM
jgi:hypothetical protein